MPYEADEKNPAIYARILRVQAAGVWRDGVVPREYTMPSARARGLARRQDVIHVRGNDVRYPCWHRRLPPLSGV